MRAQKIMSNPTNKNKEEPLDESILEETPPNINEPQKEEDPIEEEKKETIPDKEESIEEPEVLEEKKSENKEPEIETSAEKRHKAQQTEAQILAARNREFINKVDQASKLPEPTIDELKAYISNDGAEWDDLTSYEQTMAKKNYRLEKQFSIVNEAVQITKKIDEWAIKVDEFIDSTENKAEFVKLQGHEAEFRAFAMKESHRGAAIDTLLLPAFLQNLPTVTKKRGSIFETGGGGEAPEKPGKISTEEAARIRETKGEKAYKRLVQSGQIDDDI